MRIATRQKDRPFLRLRPSTPRQQQKTSSERKGIRHRLKIGDLTIPDAVRIIHHARPTRGHSSRPDIISKSRYRDEKNERISSAKTGQCASGAGL